MSNKEKSLKNQIINLGKKLYLLRLVAARSGNLSARLNKHYILITATGSSLGTLSYKDIIKVGLSNKDKTKDRQVSSEFPLHSLIYKNFPAKAVIHCHPPLANGYFAVYPKLKTLTLETKFYLKNLPVVNRKSLTITEPELVIKALKKSNLVVVKNHGVVSIGQSFTTALYLIEVLEEAVKVAAVARLFKKRIFDSLDKKLKENLSR